MSSWRKCLKLSDWIKVNLNIMKPDASSSALKFCLLFALFQKAAAKVEGNLPPVQEVTPPETSKEPKTSSGCILQWLRYDQKVLGSLFVWGKMTFEYYFLCYDVSKRDVCVLMHLKGMMQGRSVVWSWYNFCGKRLEWIGGVIRRPVALCVTRVTFE